jgi:hypothetical protein
MNKIKISTLASIAIALFLVLEFSSSAFAQGRGRGGGRPVSSPNIGRPTTGPGVDRGIGTSSTRSNGRSDTGRDTASGRSDGRYDAGIERARLMRENSNKADREIRENPRLQDITRINARDLRAGYESALALNPNLTFGNYVAANMLARNLGERYSNVTTSAILAGLSTGDSIGETLRYLGVGKDEAKRAEKEAKRQIKEAKN